MEEFLATLNAEIGCRDVSTSGFALYSDDPIEKGLCYYLRPDEKASENPTFCRIKLVPLTKKQMYVLQTHRHLSE